jgi:hypothetical protein
VETYRPFLGAVVQLGRCFDLLNEAVTAILASGYQALVQAYADQSRLLPVNRGSEGKRRELDCLVLNDCLGGLKDAGLAYDTVRGAFLEGDPGYRGAGIRRETHIQIAVRNPDCILGVYGAREQSGGRERGPLSAAGIHIGSPRRSPWWSRLLRQPCGVPDRHRAVPSAAGQAVTVWAEEHALDTSGVHLESKEFLAGLRIPHLS